MDRIDQLIAAAEAPATPAPAPDRIDQLIAAAETPPPPPPSWLDTINAAANDTLAMAGRAITGTGDMLRHTLPDALTPNYTLVRGLLHSTTGLKLPSFGSITDPLAQAWEAPIRHEAAGAEAASAATPAAPITDLNSFAQAGVRTAIPSLAAIGLGLATGGAPLVAGTLFGSATYDRALQEAAAQGMSPEKARAYAASQGIIEGGTEALSNALQLKLAGLGGPLKALTAPAKSLIGRLLRTGARSAGIGVTEYLEEVATELGQYLSDKAAGMPTPDLSERLAAMSGPALAASTIFALIGLPAAYANTPVQRPAATPPTIPAAPAAATPPPIPAPPVPSSLDAIYARLEALADQGADVSGLAGMLGARLDNDWSPTELLAAIAAAEQRLAPPSSTGAPPPPLPPPAAASATEPSAAVLPAPGAVAASATEPSAAPALPPPLLAKLQSALQNGGWAGRSISPTSPRAALETLTGIPAPYRPSEYGYTRNQVSFTPEESRFLSQLSDADLLAAGLLQSLPDGSITWSGPGTVAASEAQPGASASAQLQDLRARIAGPVPVLTTPDGLFERDDTGTWYRLRRDPASGTTVRTAEVRSPETIAALQDQHARAVTASIVSARDGRAPLELDLSTIAQPRPVAQPATPDPAVIARIQRGSSTGAVAASASESGAAPRGSRRIPGAQSLTAWVRSLGGITLTRHDGAPVDHGTELAEILASNGRPGRRLRSSTASQANTPDLLLQRAIEAGFLHEAASLDDFTDALQSELRGTGFFYAQTEGNSQAIADHAEDRLDSRDWSSATVPAEEPVPFSRPAPFRVRRLQRIASQAVPHLRVQIHDGGDTVNPAAYSRSNPNAQLTIRSGRWIAFLGEDGAIHINARQLPAGANPALWLREQVFHEALHAGIRALPAADRSRLLRAAFAHLTATERTELLGRGYAESELAEERLAFAIQRLAANPSAHPSLWHKLVAFTARWLRRAGWSGRVTEAELRLLLQHGLAATSHAPATSSPTATRFALATNKTLRQVERTLPIIPIANRNIDIARARSLRLIQQEARTAFDSFPAQVHDREGRPVTLLHQNSGGLDGLFKHLTESRTAGFDANKAFWIPLVPATIQEATIKLQQGDRWIYVGRYDNGYRHIVVTDPFGRVTNQGPRTYLFTQFGEPVGATGYRSELKVHELQKSPPSVEPGTSGLDSPRRDQVASGEGYPNPTPPPDSVKLSRPPGAASASEPSPLPFTTPPTGASASASEPAPASPPPIPGRRTHQLATRILAQPDHIVSPEVRAQIAPDNVRTYQTVSDDLMAQQASQWIASVGGVVPAADMVASPTLDLHPDLRTEATIQIMRLLQDRQLYLTQKGDTRAAKILARRQGELASWLIDFAEQAGRAISNLRKMFAADQLQYLDPTSWQVFAQRQVKKAVEAKLGQSSLQLISQLLQALRSISAQAISATDPTAPQPVTAAVTRATRGTGPAGSLWQRYQARITAQIKSQVAQALHPQAPGTPPPVQEFTDRLTKAIRAQVAATLPQAEARASKPEAPSAASQFIAQTREAIANPDRYAEALRTVQLELATKYANDPAALAALDAFLQASQIPLNRSLLADAITRELDIEALARQHFSATQLAGDSLAERLVAEIGLTQAQAKELTRTIHLELRLATNTAKRQAIDRIISQAKPRTARAIRSTADRLIEISNMGGLSEPAAWEALAPKLDLPAWSATHALEVHRQAQRLQLIPAGAERQERVAHLLSYIARAHGISGADLAVSAWYASILSGTGTHATNFIDTAINVLFEFTTKSISDPVAAAEMLRGLASGFHRGLTDARGILATGVVTGTRLRKAEAMSPLELKAGAAGPRHWTQAAKYVSRAMAAEDIVNFRAAEAMRARQLALDQARAEGITGRAARRARIDELLHQTPAERDAAAQQAALEGLTGWRARRRTAEILEQATASSLVADAAEFARRATYNQSPEGSLGLLAQYLAGISRNIPAFRLIVPFTQVVANVANRTLDYSPWGVKRAFFGQWGGDTATEAPTGRDRRDLLVKAASGTLALTALLALALAYKDDEDPAFDITSDGPTDPNKRAQLLARGWLPYSIKLGDRYYSYRYTPFHAVGAIVGAWADADRYQNHDTRELTERSSLTGGAIFRVLLSQSYLSGLQEFLSDITTPSGNALHKFNRKLASAITPRILQDIDAALFPDRSAANTPLESLTQSVPLLRQAVNPPARDVLAQPITRSASPLARFTSTKTTDPLNRLLLDRQLFIPGISGSTTIPGATWSERRRATRAQRYDLNTLSGAIIRDQLTQNLDWLRSADHATAQAYINQLAQHAHAQAKQAIPLE
jgi:hypothetical protein